MSETIVESSELSKIDMAKWRYEASDDVYWQTGLSYAESPADSSLETMGLFVPGAYFTGTESDAVKGSMCWCPITNLDVADEAYEWNMGNTRSGLSEDEQTWAILRWNTMSSVRNVFIFVSRAFEYQSCYVESFRKQDSEGNHQKWWYAYFCIFMHVILRKIIKYASVLLKNKMLE